MSPPAERPHGSARPLRLLAAAAGALLLGTAPAGAASILSVTPSVGAGQDAPLFDDIAPNRSERASTLTLESSDPSSFLTRFAAVLAADAEAGGASESLRFDVQYTVTIAIDAPVGEAWELTIDHSRVGTLTLVADGTGRASARAMGVVTTITGATLRSGTLDLGAVPNLNGSGGGDLPFDQATTAVLSGTGAQTVTLQFDFQLRTHTISQGGSGDEAAVRMGIAAAIAAFTAGDYPGIGGRVMSSDGQFVSGSLRTLPEPGTFAMVSAGMLGLAGLGQRRARARVRAQPRPHRRPSA